MRATFMTRAAYRTAITAETCARSTIHRETNRHLAGRSATAIVTPVLEAGVSTRALRPILAGLALHQADVAQAIADAGLDPSALTDPDARVPHRSAIALWQIAVERTGDDAFGLHVAEATEFGVFDVQSYAFVSSPTLGEGLARIASYQRLNHDAARVIVETHDDLVTIRHALPGGVNVPRHVAEFIVATLVLAARAATETTLPIVELRFAHREPADTSEHQRILAAPLRFDANENAIVLPSSALDLPHARADARLVQMLDRHANDLLGRLPEVRDFTDRVRAVLAAELRGGNPSAEHVADTLHMSVRTLSRRLADLGTSHKELLDTLRCELAKTHLAADALAIGEVAFLLGFSEASAFHRAFRRWTGRTPQEFRRDPTASERAGG
jgi:AraC-like DNA-binding protein